MHILSVRNLGAKDAGTFLSTSTKKTNMNCLLALFVALSNFGVSPSSDDVVGVPHELLPDFPLLAGTSIAGYKCQKQSTCPRGLLLLVPGGNVLGCSVSSMFEEASDCSGSCYTCDGANAETYVCVPATEQNCTVPEVHRIMGCGLRRIHQNACTSAQPSGTPTTPNGCYCKTESGFIYEVYSCSISECQ